jgi:hypothetical protein
MANTLTAFLSQNAVKIENTKVVVSKRFVDENKKPIQWEIRALNAGEDEDIRKSATRKIPVPGRRGQYQPETDINLYLAKMAAACTVFPNLFDAELQDSYNVKTPEDLLRAMLTSGEYADFLQTIQNMNGYDVSTEEMVEDAKN